MRPPLIVPLPGFEPLAGSVAVLETTPPTIERFENGELEVRLDASVDGRGCFLLGTVAPPGDRLAELLLTADTLLRNGANSLHAVLPYLAYARQDRPNPNISLAAAWIGRLLANAGIADLTTIDIHSRAARELIGLPVTSLSPADLFGRALAGWASREAVVVAPDRGAHARADAVLAALGLDRPLVRFGKERDAGGVTHTTVEGEVAPRAIVVDDILDTGGTLVSCCRKLRALGVEETAIAVTHGLFTGARWRELADLGVGAIHVTDSVPDVRARARGAAGGGASELVRVHSVGPLLAAAIT